MCGIVGYIGNQDVKGILLGGLEKLEYRGYDSAGIAVHHQEQVNLYRATGRIAKLRAKVDDKNKGTMGIGHTRWATHGGPSVKNAHPHQSVTGRFTLVHNGVIENYQELKQDYLAGVSFSSDTDSEVIVQLIDKMYQQHQDVAVAFRHCVRLLKGSYAIVLVDTENQDMLYVAKHKSPLLIGLGKGFNMVASDVMAALSETNQFMEIMDGEIAFVGRQFVELESLDGDIVDRKPFTSQLDANDMEKGTYDHFMLKEIDEQPFVLRNIIQKYQDDHQQLKLDKRIQNQMTQADRIYIIACGTSYHAGLVGKQLLEKIAGVPVEVHIASEFSYNMPLLSEKPLFLFISQSGETADSRSVLVKIKEMGYPAITLTNVPGSTLSREADHTLELFAGPEIAVASTKAYTAQLSVLLILAVDTARAKGMTLDFDPLKELAIVANAMEVLASQKEKFTSLVKQFLKTTCNAFFIGRGMDYNVCLEGALKLKEISYIQAEGFAAGELKHGTIALIEDGTPVIALVTQHHVAGAVRSNIQEVLARGANVLTIGMKGLEQQDDAFTLPTVHEMLTPLLTVVPLQLIAYEAALQRGCDVDKPRNLAKSVTVE